VKIRIHQLARALLNGTFIGLVVGSIAYALYRDKVLAGVMLTSITDAMGFFIFLGLASVFLL